jgi:tight adherence protein C
MSFELALTLAAVFLSVALVSGSAVAFAAGLSAPGRRRVRKLAQAGNRSLVKDAESLTPSLGPAMQRLAMFIPKSPKDMSRLQKRMSLAGYHGAAPAIVFAAFELATPAVLGGAALLLAHGPTALMLALAGGMFGYILPGFVLLRLIARRKKVIQNGLPDALDLFIVCLEAGSSLDQAILKTSQDLDVPYPPLADELRMITTEMRAGKPRLEAFRNFAKRTEVDDVRSLVSMLVQADRFGTSVAQALRIHAETSRTKRRQRAEERAQKIGVKLVFPLVICLFPAFYVVALGSAFIKIMQFFTEQIK